ncbi:MAG: TetR/AcrR family transcriptional regulator [Pseudomonadota bacterium]
MTLDHDSVRERVLTLAEEAIATDGHEGLKARGIAQAAGISVGTIYNLFEDLDGLRLQVNSRLMDRLEAVAAGVLRDLAAKHETDARISLLALARAYVGFVETHGRSWTAMLAFNRQVDTASMPDWYLARQDQLFEIIGDILKTTSFMADATTRRTASRALWSGVHGIVTLGYRRTETDDWAAETWAQVELLVTAFVAGLHHIDAAGTVRDLTGNSDGGA